MNIDIVMFISSIFVLSMICIYTLRRIYKKYIVSRSYIFVIFGIVLLIQHCLECEFIVRLMQTHQAHIQTEKNMQSDIKKIEDSSIVFSKSAAITSTLYMHRKIQENCKIDWKVLCIWMVIKYFLTLSMLYFSWNFIFFTIMLSLTAFDLLLWYNYNESPLIKNSRNR